MELRKNDYIRTNKRIFKIEDINDYKICVLDTFCELFYSHATGTTAFFMSDKDEPYTIIKSSPNILKLLEPMDLLYVDIDGGFEGGIIVPRIPETQNELNEFIELIKSGHWILKGVVTHEQLKSRVYEVK